MNPAPDLLLRGRRVVTPEGMRPASVHVSGGRIVAVGGYDAAGGDVRVVDAGDAVLMPGLVDTHVHVNEPGRTEWEGFATATRAAAAGGVTTLVEMPLNSVPATITAAALHAKREAAEGRCSVDVGFWGGVVPGNAAELRTAMPLLAELGAPLLVHAELPAALEHAATAVAGMDRRRYATYPSSRPPAACRPPTRRSSPTRSGRCWGGGSRRAHVANGPGDRVRYSLPVLADGARQGTCRGGRAAR